MSVSGDGETVDSDVMVGAHAGNNIGHNVGVALDPHQHCFREDQDDP